MEPIIVTIIIATMKVGNNIKSGLVEKKTNNNGTNQYMWK